MRHAEHACFAAADDSPGTCPRPAGNIALHALYSPSISGVSLLAGAAVMGLTFAVPYQASGDSAGARPPTARSGGCGTCHHGCSWTLSVWLSFCKYQQILREPLQHVQLRPRCLTRAFSRLGLARCPIPQHYVKTNGGLKPIEALTSYFGAVPDHFK